MKIQTFTIVAGTAVCDAKCPFCISKMTPKQGINLKLQRTNWLNFEKACRLAEMNNVTTVLITGKGEPLLYPDQITEFLEHLKPYRFPLIEIQTNGMIIERNFKKYERYLKKWRQLGLGTISISIVHYKKEKNKQIYTSNSEYINLDSLIKWLHRLGISVRLSAIMLKGFIDSPNEIKRLIEFAKKNHVEQLTVRPVRTPQQSENKKVYEWTKKHQLTKDQLENIEKFLEKNADKLMTLIQGAIVYDYQKQNICLTDCLTIKPGSEDLRQLIFFPDGHLRYDWQYPGAILL